MIDAQGRPGPAGLTDQVRVGISREFEHAHS